MDHLDVVVVGAGVIGLTTAVELAESGRTVEVRSAAVPELTTSATAGAMWGLSFVERSQRVLRWSRSTLEYLTALAADHRTGIRLVEGIEASRQESEPPGWLALFPEARICEPADLPPGFVTGHRFTVPVVDMPVYLGYLRDRLLAAGGRLRIATVSALSDLLSAADIVVNCAGVRAGELARDGEVFPVRGQVVVTANPGITDFFAEDTGTGNDLLYVLPQGEKVILGGTAEPGRWSRRADPGTARAILDRCTAVVPSLAGAPVLEHRVGLRPGRHRIRFGRQPAPDGRLIHSYGHGGAGVSLSWGCAQALLAELEPDSACRGTG